VEAAAGGIHVMNGADVVLEALPVAVYLTDADGQITFFNQAAAELWGQSPEPGVRWWGAWRLYWPDGRRMEANDSPMAQALREGRPIRGVEAILQKPDGRRIRIMPYPTPLRDAAGRITGGIELVLDMTAQYDANVDTARLAAIVASSDDAIISKTLEGRITSWNAGATRIFGYEANELIGEPITRIIPPELLSEEEDILGRIRRGDRVDHFETVRLAKDGRRIDVSITVSPVRDRLGRIVGASKVSRDISERKQAETLQRLLTEELTHRVKNTLAMIRSIATQSLARARSPGDFVPAFSGRIQALAQAHDLITQARLQGADLGELVREQVLLGAGDDRRMTFSGPQLRLDAQAALHLALVLHELGTNARKYGALSMPGGRLAVTWELHTNGGRHLMIEWKEQGGPPVSLPRERGFGTALIEQTLHSHGGEIAMRFGSDGVTARIDLPMPEQSWAPDASAAIEPPEEIGAAEPAAGRARLRGKRILVIEDEPLVSMEIEACLEAAGCAVVGPVGRLARAKVLVAEAECDAALLDANLAGERVDELAMQLARKGVPFAFVTGYGRDALPAGFRERMVLAKPFSQERLLAVVELLIERDAGAAQAQPGTL
jgi:PAS domain S-box-containing protein